MLFKQFVNIYHTALVFIKGQTFMMNIKSQSLISRGLTLTLDVHKKMFHYLKGEKNSTPTESELIGEYSTFKEYGLKIQKSSRHLK